MTDTVMTTEAAPPSAVLAQDVPPLQAEQTDGVLPDTAQAVDWMRLWPTERMHLWAKKVNPKTGEEGPSEGYTFERTDVGYVAMETWISVRQGQSNLYFVVNDIVPNITLGVTKRENEKGVLKTITKPRESDIVAMVASHIDVDYRPETDPNLDHGTHHDAERARIIGQLEHYEPRFNAINFSGGGGQAFQIFKEKIPLSGEADVAEWKRVNLHLTRTLEGADKCQSLDHVMRLPGTTNIPSKRKLEAGRVLSSASVLRFDSADKAHDPYTLPKVAEEETPRAKPRGQKERNGSRETDAPSEPPVTSIDDPRLANVTPDIKTLIVESAPDEVFVDMSVACRLLKAGCSDFVVSSVFQNFKIGDGELDHNAVRIARLIARAHDFIHDPDLADMNERHCVIKLGGKTRILTWEDDPMFPGRKVAEYSTVEDFCAFHSNRRKLIMVPGKVGVDGDGNPTPALMVPKQIPIGTWWWNHKQRRQYSGIIFEPSINQEVVGGKLNLWCGFAIGEQAGDCSLYLAHLRDNICDGNEEAYQYLLRWMAYCMQHPDRQGEVAWVMRGKKGTGKTFAAKQFGSLLGRHYLAITNPEHLTGKFNSHLQEAVAVLADECFFAGDRRHEQMLKTLITGDSIIIEPKGVNSYAARNHIHLIMSTNQDWAVPASEDERRYFVLDVAEHHREDFEYFEAIGDQMDAGGRAAFLHMMLNMDLSEFNVRRVPRTKGLARQQALSRRGLDSIIEEVCHEGRLPCADKDHPDVTITSGEEAGRGFDHFIRSKADADLRRLGPGKVKRALKKQWGTSHWRESAGRRRAGVQFPPLEDLRKAFTDKHGSTEWRAADVKQWEASEDGIPF